MNTLPDWPAGLSEDALVRHFGVPTLARGRAYQSEGRVGRLQVSGDLVMARVRGAGGQVYQASVVRRGGTGPLVAAVRAGEAIVKRQE